MRKNCLHLLPLAIFFVISHRTAAQQVMMQGWYWDYPKTAIGRSWADTLRLKAASLKKAGITHIWFPPHAVASSGTKSNGYDPKDLFIGDQVTGLGTREALNAMLAEFAKQGIVPVADLIFNHRDGGRPEPNPPVKKYITQLYTLEKEPFPSDRFRCILPLGGSTKNGAGDYYFKISSKTQGARFFNLPYRVRMETSVRHTVSAQPQLESEPNGGNDCGQPFNSIELGKDLLARVDAAGCKTDEFKLNLTVSDFNLAGDTLVIDISNLKDSSGIKTYSDHRIYGVYSDIRKSDIVDELQYQTYTDFTAMPSRRGQMNFENFKPNSANVATTALNGDWDSLLFFYDYDQFNQATKDSLISYAKWNWQELNVRGLRMDAVKHFSPVFVADLLNSLHNSGMDPNLVVGEWYSGNPAELKSWVDRVLEGMNAAAKAAISPRIFDFALRENLRKACNDKEFDVRNVFNGSLHDATGLSGFNVVTFINNHDFRDTAGFSSLVKNSSLLAYVYILTNNQLGVPLIFYPDYYGYPPRQDSMYQYHPLHFMPLKKELDVLMKVLKTYINNSPSVDYLNRFNSPYSGNMLAGSAGKCLVYQLQGSTGNKNREVIVAINFADTTLKLDQQINTRSGLLKKDTRFTAVAGNSAFPYAVVSGSSQVYIELPPSSYAVWVQETVPASMRLHKKKEHR